MTVHLAVVERVQAFPAGLLPDQVRRRWDRGEGVDQLHVRHLQRWELGTLYDVIVSDVSALMRTTELEWSLLLFDATGVGRGIKDMFTAAFQRGGDGSPVAASEDDHG